MSEFSKTPITTVIAGLGRAGWNIHWRQLLKGHPSFRVVGVIEPLAERRQEAREEIGCRAFASLAEFLSDPVGELVILATPSGEHGPEAVACLQAGLHVIVDKPMCQGIKEADAMIAVVRQKGLILSCYHPYRFSRDSLVFRDVINSGRLGRLVEIKCNRSKFLRRNDWVMRKAKGAGHHNVWGAHTIDQCLQLAGSPVREIFSDLQCTITPGDADDHCKIVLRCESGVLIDAELSDCMAFPPQPEWMIAGTRGGMVSDPEGVRVRWFDPKETPPLAMQDGSASGRLYGNDDLLPWQEEIIPFPETRGVVEFYDNIADAIRNGAPLMVTPESVRETIAVLETCRHQNPHVWEGVE